MTYRMNGLSLLALAIMLLAACTDDSHQSPVQNSGLQLLSATRAGGATPLTTDGTSFMMYLATPDNQAPTQKVFTYNGTESTWNASAPVTVREEAQYYIYGYMPYDGSLNHSITPVNDSYANGATMTLSGLPAISDIDFCVVTGVQHVEHPEDTKQVEEGEFGFFTSMGNKNYVNLLMGHVYSQLVLNISVDAIYSELRKIKLKKVKLKANYSTMDATVSLKSGGGIEGVTYTPSATGTSERELTIAEEYLPVSPTVFPLDFGYCAPSVFNGLTIESTYDVYDRKGNRLHERVSENKITVSGMGHGEQLSLQLKVVPTYLYILSDPDLDNPNIVISE